MTLLYDLIGINEFSLPMEHIVFEHSNWTLVNINDSAEHELPITTTEQSFLDLYPILLFFILSEHVHDLPPYPIHWQTFINLSRQNLDLGFRLVSDLFLKWNKNIIMIGLKLD